MSKLDDMRYQARLQKFDNSEQERVAIREADQVIFSAVRDHEQHLAKVTEDYASENQATTSLVGERVAEIRDFRREVELGDVTPTAENAERLKQYRNQVESLTARIEDARRRSQSQIARAEDPYANFERIAAKYPPLFDLRPKRKAQSFDPGKQQRLDLG